MAHIVARVLPLIRTGRMLLLLLLLLLLLVQGAGASPHRDWVCRHKPAPALQVLLAQQHIRGRRLQLDSRRCCLLLLLLGMLRLIEGRLAAQHAHFGADAAGAAHLCAQGGGGGWGGCLRQACPTQLQPTTITQAMPTV